MSYGTIEDGTIKCHSQGLFRGMYSAGKEEVLIQGLFYRLVGPLQNPYFSLIFSCCRSHHVFIGTLLTF